VNKETSSVSAGFRWGRFALILATYWLCYFVVFVLANTVFGSLDQAFGFLGLILCGLVMGVLASLLWDPQVERRYLEVLGTALLAFVCTLLPLVLLQFETLICIVIALPIVGVLMALSIWGTRLIVRWRQNHATATYSALIVVPLALLSQQGAFLDSDFLSPSATEVLQSEIVINASPETVWAHTLEIAPIREEERIWTTSHALLGAPQPIDAQLNGAIRDLRWTKGVQFQEHITQRDENTFLEWRFVFHKPETLAAIDPNIHPQSRTLFLEKGSYRLIPEQDGRTRVLLTTTYHMKTPINGYLRAWGTLFLDDFQTSVLAVIKSRAEASLR